MAYVCPNLSDPKIRKDWNAMLSSIGEGLSYDVFAFNNDTVPTLGISNGNPSGLFKFLKKNYPKLSTKLWYLSKTKTFNDDYERLLQKDDNGDFVLTKSFIDTYILEKGLNLPLFFKPIREIGVNATTHYRNDINVRFFQVMFGELSLSTDTNPEVNFNRDIEGIYRFLKLYYIKQATTNAELSKTYSPLLKHWNELVENHKQYLKQLRIDVDKESVWEEEDNKQKDNVGHAESVTVSMTDLIEDPIRMLIASLPNVTREGESLTELLSDDKYNLDSTKNFNTVSTANYNKTMKLLNNELAMLSTEEDMISKLQELALKYNYLGVLLRRLGIGLPVEATTPMHLMLRGQFFRAFDHNKNNPILGIIKDSGDIIFDDRFLDSLTEVIKNRWLNRAKNLAENNSGFLTLSDDNRYLINVEKFSKYSVKQLQGMTGGQRLAIMAQFGFESESNSGESIDGNNGAIINFLTWARANIKPNTSLNDLFNRDVIEIHKEISALLTEASLYEANDMDLMYFNQDNKLEYVITLNSYLSKTVTRLNDYHLLKKKGKDQVPEEIKHLTPYNVKTKSGNHSTVNSRLLGNDIRIVLMKGYKSEFKDGKEISSLKMTDYKGFTFTALLKGMVPYLRSADRKLEYALASSIFSQKTVERKYFKEDMLGYLKDELTTTFAHLRGELGINLLNANKHLLSLRTFDFLFEGQDLSDILYKFNLVNKKTKLYSKEGAQELAELFISQHKDEIDRDLDSWITNSVALNITSLLEDGVIQEYGDNKYIIKAIDKEVLNKLGTVSKVGDNNVIAKNEFENITMLATYNYFIGAQEQLKLIIGDLANFKNPIDFHKRTTGGTSTKTSTTNSQEINDMINFHYPSMDGVLAGKTAKEIVYADVITTNDALNKNNPEYSKSKGSDGQAHSTLDEYRRFMNKIGQWGDPNDITQFKEVTYQYESQLLGLRLLADLKLKDKAVLQPIFKFTKEDFIRLFGEHTNNTFPDKPMFRGKVIDKTKLPVINPIKPQGFGNKSGVDSFTTNDFSKMSVSPIFPSELSDDRLKHYLSMMKNGVGYLFFQSDKKSDVSLNSQGELNQLLPGTLVDSTRDIITEINYDNFGLQVDIPEHTSGRVTESTQRTRLEFVDLFENGKFIGKDESLAVDKKDFDAVRNELVLRDRVELLEELGLTHDSDGNYKLERKDIPKFRKTLQDAFLTRNMPYNIVEGLNIVLDNDRHFFDVLVNKRELENVLISLGRSRVISRKVHGEMLVQESNAYYQNDLKFYTNDNGNITRMEVMVPLPEAWNEYVESIGGLKVFNKRIADGTLDKRIFTIPANRIPAHGMNSLEALVVKRFFPSYMGAKVILPSDITVKSGTDFDVDKLTAYFKNVRIKKGLKYIEYSTDLKQVYNDKYADIKDFHNKLLKVVIAANADSARTFNKIKPYVENNAELQAAFENYIDGLPSTSALMAKQKINEYLTLDDYTYNDWVDSKEQMKTIPDFETFKMYYTDNEGNVDYVKANSKEALENKLMEIAEKVTLSVERFDDLVKPTNADTLKKLASEVEDRSPFKDELKKVESGKWSNVTQFWYNTHKAETFWTAKSGLSITATHTVSHASTQHTPIRVDSPVVKLFLPGNKDKYTFGLVNSSDGVRISHILAEYLTAFVDAATDDFIFMINANPETVTNMFFLLKNGISPKVIVKFFTQPIILDYLKKRNINESASYQGVDGYEDKTKTVKNLLSSKKYGISEKVENSMAYKLIDSYINNPNSEDLSKIKKIFEGYHNLSLATLSKKKLSDDEQVQILDNFLSYQQYATMLTKLQQVTRPDSGLVTNRTELRYLADKFQKLKDSKFFNEEDLKNFVNNSFLRELFISREELLKSTKPFFMFEAPQLRKIFNEYFDWLDEVDLPIDKVKKIITEIEDQFITAIIINKLTKNISVEKLQEYYKSAFIGKKSLPKEILKLKNLMPNNALVRELTPLIQEFDTVTNRELEFDNIKLYNRRFTTDELNELTSAYEELLDHPDKNVHIIAKKLMYFLYLQSGLSNSPINFIKVVPNRYLLSLVNDFDLKIDPNAIYNLFDTIMRNSWKNRDLVPKVRKSGYITSGTVNGTISINKNSRNAKYPYLVKQYYLVSKSEKNALVSKKKRVPKDVFLYRATDKVVGDNIVYELVEKLGDGWRMFELSLYGIYSSILSTNKIDYKVNTKGTVDEDIEEDDVNNEASFISRYTKKMHSLGSEESGVSDAKLNSIVKDYLKDIGVSYESVEKILDRGVEVSKAVSAVDLVQKTVLAVEGKISRRDLPEEAAHWYVELLGSDNNVYKTMLRNITKFDEYTEVMNNTEYRKLYNDNEDLFRKEAVGKLIANNIVKEFDTIESPTVYRWMKYILNFLQALFSGTSLYRRAAFDILNKNLENLKITAQEVSENYQDQIEEDFIQILKDESEDVIINPKDLSEYEIDDAADVKKTHLSVLTSRDLIKVNRKGETINIKKGVEIGFVTLRNTKPGLTQIDHIGLEKQYQGLGLGTQVYKQIIAKSLEMGININSDNVFNISKDAKRTWDSLVKYGYANKRIPNEGNLSLYETKVPNSYLLFSVQEWNDLPGKQFGNKKILYEHYPKSADITVFYLEDKFGKDNVSSVKVSDGSYKIVVSRPKDSLTTATTIAENKEELSKEDSNTGRDHVLQNFDKYFPGYDYLTNEEKAIFVDQMTSGQLEVMCGF